MVLGEEFWGLMFKLSWKDHWLFCMQKEYLQTKYLCYEGSNDL